MRLRRSRRASSALSLEITSLLSANPVSVRKVDADDRPAATIPASSTAPIAVGMTLLAAQIMAVLFGSMSALSNAMTGPDR